MKNTWKVAVAAAVLVGSVSAAKAQGTFGDPYAYYADDALESQTALTLDGQTGMFANPTAEIVQRSAPQIQLGFQTTTADGSRARMYGIGGAVQVAKNLELSANFNRGSFAGEHTNNWRLGGKYRLLDQQDKGISLAIGGSYEDFGLPSPVDLTHYGFYAAATKAFGSSSDRAPIEATLGVRWDHAKAKVLWLSASDSNTSVYAGASVPLTSDGRLRLIGELGSKIVKDGKSPHALGLRYQSPDNGFSLSAGLGRTNLFELIPGTDTGFFLQAGYQFGR